MGASGDANQLVIGSMPVSPRSSASGRHRFLGIELPSKSCAAGSPSGLDRIATSPYLNGCRSPCTKQLYVIV